jgi:hypothetical protein
LPSAWAPDGLGGEVFVHASSLSTSCNSSPPSPGGQLFHCVFHIYHLLRLLLKQKLDNFLSILQSHLQPYTTNPPQKMPPINHAALSAGVIAISVAVAAAIAVYESPELRRMADDLRRRIAVALHSLGDDITPPNREPLFNRPEDAEGFLVSRGLSGEDAGMEADEETMRRQREELMYWNRLRLEKQAKEEEVQEKQTSSTTLSRQGSSFDDFLSKDESGEQGMYVFNTGVDLAGNVERLLRRRGEGVRGLKASMYANPFGDEHGIDADDQRAVEAEAIAPQHEEIMSDIYNASPAPASATLSAEEPSTIEEVLFDADSLARTRMDGAQLLERETSQQEYVTAGQDDRDGVYSSIQAWAQGSTNGFYSPLPVSPPAPLSEPEIISDGELTPTDSASLAGSGIDVGNDARSDVEGQRYYDVMSDDEDSIHTPNSWSEVGSVVSENDVGHIHA